MKLNAWEITILVLYVLAIGLDLERTGKPKTGTYNVFTTLIATAISLFLLYMAGLFQGR